MILNLEKKLEFVKFLIENIKFKKLIGVCKAFYRRDCHFRLVFSVRVEDVFQEFVKVVKSFK